MISVVECASFAGLAPNELILGVSPSRRHDSLLQSYLSISSPSKAVLRELIVSDLRGFLALGAMRQAADRLMVLRRLLSDHPEARIVSPPMDGMIRIRGWRSGSATLNIRLSHRHKGKTTRHFRDEMPFVQR
jgi:hypothetical protein